MTNRYTVKQLFDLNRQTYKSTRSMKVWDFKNKKTMHVWFYGDNAIGIHDPTINSFTEYISGRGVETDFWPMVKRRVKSIL